MTDATRYRVGVLGCGRAAVALHLPALQHVPGARVVALADSDANALNTVAGRFGVSSRHADIDGLLAAGVDVVAVCVPAAQHVDAALVVLESGKHLLVEKPLATDRGGCERLLAAAARSPSRVTVGFNLRCHRLIEQARALIAAGTLGPIEAVSSTWTSAIRRRGAVPGWRNARATGGGALFEIAVHHFDLWRFLLATDIAEISAHARSDEWPDETATVTARLANGAVACGVFSERSSDRNTLHIMGRDGSLALDLFRHDGFEWVRADDQPGLGSRARRAVRAAAGVPRGLLLARRGGDFLLSYQREWQLFLDAIDAQAAPASTLQDGYAAVRAVLAAIESADSGRPVKL
jgi:myo-inositol 2-dehydrogenase / D-chiro-inositol 1-dehydrogenase